MLTLFVFCRTGAENSSSVGFFGALSKCFRPHVYFQVGSNKYLIKAYSELLDGSSVKSIRVANQALRNHICIVRDDVDIILKLKEAKITFWVKTPEADSFGNFIFKDDCIQYSKDANAYKVDFPHIYKVSCCPSDLENMTISHFDLRVCQKSNVYIDICAACKKLFAYIYIPFQNCAQMKLLN